MNLFIKILIIIFFFGFGHVSQYLMQVYYKNIISTKSIILEDNLLSKYEILIIDRLRVNSKFIYAKSFEYNKDERFAKFYDETGELIAYFNFVDSVSRIK